MHLDAHRRAAEHTGSIYGVSVSIPEPCLLASAGDDETVRLWEDREHSGCWRQACCATVEDPAMCVSFSPDSSLLATGTSGGTAHLYKVSRGTDVDGRASLASEASLCAHPEEVYACEFLEAMDGRLCTASDTSLFLWDLAAAVLVQQCGPPDVPADKRLAAMPERWRPGYVFSLSQQPSGGGLLAGTCSDGAVRIWSATKGALQPLWGRRLHAGMASSCAFTADGNAVLSISKAGEAVLLDIRQRAELACATAPVPLHGCHRLPDGKLALCGSHGTVLLVDPADVADGLQLTAIHQTEQRDALYCISSSAIGSLLIAGGALCITSESLSSDICVIESASPHAQQCKYVWECNVSVIAGEVMDTAVEAASANGKSHAGTPDESAADTLFDAGDVFTSNHDGRVVFSNSVSKQPVARRHSTLHVWDVT